jgi:uncharacterized metal-binding protein
MAMRRSSSFRRAEIAAGEEIRFTCDGEAVVAAATDTIASALVAAGRTTFMTSPHDGAPRGGFCFIGRCGDCQMVIDGQPGTMACVTPVRAGMVVETQSGLGHWDSVSPS